MSVTQRASEEDKDDGQKRAFELPNGETQPFVHFMWDEDTIEVVVVRGGAEGEMTTEPEETTTEPAETTTEEETATTEPAETIEETVTDEAAEGE